jgi:hypothetical protein
VALQQLMMTMMMALLTAAARHALTTENGITSRIDARRAVQQQLAQRFVLGLKNG